MSKRRSKRTRDEPVLEYFEWRVTELSGYGYAVAEPTSRDIAREAANALALDEGGILQWRRDSAAPWMAAEEEQTSEGGGQ